MSIEAIEAIEKFIAKRDGREYEGTSISEIKEKIAEYIKNRDPWWGNCREAFRDELISRKTCIREGRTLEREKLRE